MTFIQYNFDSVDKGIAGERSHEPRTGYEIASTFRMFRVRETRYFFDACIRLFSSAALGFQLEKTISGSFDDSIG